MTDDAAAPDADIIFAIMSGDPKGLEQLLRVHGGHVRACIGRRYPTVAADALSIALRKVWLRAESYDESKGSLRVWFLQVANNAALDLIRKAVRRKEVALDASFDAAALPTPEETDDPPDPKRERRDRALVEIVDALPPQQRDIIRADMASRDDVASASDLAAALGTSVNTIYVSRSKARKTIKEAMITRGLYQDRVEQKP